jgi:hypothetical protein
MPRKAFDVFVPQSRVERLYSQLHKMRRQRGVPVKGATLAPSEKEELSSYMIDPQYLPKDSGATGQQAVATTRPAEPVYQYSRLRNQPIKYEATPVTEPGQIATIGFFGGLKNYLYRVSDKIRQPSLSRKSARTSHVTYTLPEGLGTSGRLRAANRTALSALAITALCLLAIGVANWPSERNPGQPGQSPTVERNGGQAAGVQGISNEVQPSPASTSPANTPGAPAAASGTLSSPTTTKPKANGGGSTGGGGGSITQPVEDVLNSTCVSTVLSCMRPPVPGVGI